MPEEFLQNDLVNYKIDVAEQEDVKKMSEGIGSLVTDLSDKYMVSPASMLWRLINRLS